MKTTSTSQRNPLKRLTEAPIHGIDLPQRKPAKRVRGAASTDRRDDDANERPPRTGV